MAGPKRAAKKIKTNDTPAADVAPVSSDSPPPETLPTPRPEFREFAESQLRTVGDALGIPAEALTLEPAPPEPLRQARIGLSLPFAEVDPKLHHKRHVDLQLNREQAATLARLTTALRGQPYELTIDGSDFRREGRIIDGPAKVFYWLLNGATLLMQQADEAARGNPPEIPSA